MPQLCEKLKGNGKNFHLKRKKKLYQKFVLKFFDKNFFALNSLLGWFKAKKKFSKKFQKKFWPKKIRNFFSNEIFCHFFNFFEKLGHDYENALNFLEKKRMCSQKLIRFLCFLSLSKGTLQCWTPCNFRCLVLLLR